MRRIVQAAILMTMLSSTPTVRAGIWSDVAIGLGAAGFDLQGSRNILSGGADFLAVNNFQDATFDFGSMELTLTGPVSFDVSTGGRRLSNLDIALTTALNGDRAAQPLEYELIYDVGGQETLITGSLLLDADLSLNGFGFYELELNYSSRQTVENDGRFDNTERDFDLDFGPINVSGNIFADMLAAVTQPFFEATNTPNIFASFSGREQLTNMIDARIADVLAQLDPATWVGGSDESGSTVAGDRADATRIGPLSAAQIIESLSIVSLDGTSANPGFAPQESAGVVPEPTVLLLMLLGAPFLIRRSRRFA